MLVVKKLTREQWRESPMRELQGAASTSVERTGDATTVDKAVDAKLAADEALKAALISAHKAGTSANELARRARRVMSRPTVLALLGASGLRERIEAAIAAAGFDQGEILIMPGRGYKIPICLFLDDEETSTPNRWNAAGALLDALYKAGLGVTREGSISSLDMQQHLAEDGTAEVVDMRRAAR